MKSAKWLITLTTATVLAGAVTITRYQAGSARVMICEDRHGFVVFHPGGVRETYGAGFTLEIIEWFLALESARARQAVVEDLEVKCTRDSVRPTRVFGQKEAERAGGVRER